ncbi:hypothetical protein RUM43_001512 [Polyplax serrata]|uniref:Sulfatase N-terminal domain-containing protein n=1 Tax=Polyplax serrata TaxID=468196 RepID=A0AAN8XS95_POLSC
MNVVGILPILILITAQSVQSKSINPHIVFILADDLGWNDVGFHGSNQIPTPNIDAMAYSGIILNNYYVTPICTPSRSALLTGKYPIHTGLQHGVVHGSTPYGLSLNETLLPQFMKMGGYVTRIIGKWHLGMQHRVIYGCEPWGLSLNESILPEYLKKAGYVTSIVGKWHMGHFKQDYLPLSRGFDSHYGYWTGHQDYFDHTAIEKNKYWGYDMRRGMDVAWSDYDSYTTDLFTKEAVKVIEEHDKTKPLFLYLAHLAVHSANFYDPLQAPFQTVSKFSYIKDKQRRLFAGMLSKLDESVGSVVTALAEANMLNNSVIIFSTDNGGPAAGFNLNAASNWPLRGASKPYVKDTLWEGGVRGAAFIWSPLLPSSKVSDTLIHITDWLPTLISLTNYSSGHKLVIDGINIWPSLISNHTSSRKEILLNIDNERHVAALIHKNWKYKEGNTGIWNNWYGPSGRDMKYNWTQLYNCAATKAIQDIKPLPDKTTISAIRKKTEIRCKAPGKAQISDTYLFNLETDPCETDNLAATQPDIVQRMKMKLEMYQRTVIPPRNKPTDERSDPKNWGYVWTNWMDYI